jgi:hypothetical protein
MIDFVLGAGWIIQNLTICPLYEGLRCGFVQKFLQEGIKVMGWRFNYVQDFGSMQEGSPGIPFHIVLPRHQTLSSFPQASHH